MTFWFGVLVGAGVGGFILLMIFAWWMACMSRKMSKDNSESLELLREGNRLREARNWMLERIAVAVEGK